jgi:hypothetical protein
MFVISYTCGLSLPAKHNVVDENVKLQTEVFLCAEYLLTALFKYTYVKYDNGL